MTSPLPYQSLSRMQIASGLVLGVVGVVLSAFLPALYQLLLPPLGALWALAALVTVRRLALAGAPFRGVLVVALVIGGVSVGRFLYLLVHAA